MVRRTQAKPWSKEEDDIVERLYPTASKSDILASLPGRTWGATTLHAFHLGVKRPRSPINQTKVNRSLDADPLFQALRRIRIQQRKSVSDLAKILGYSETTIYQWETGIANPSWRALQNWMVALTATFYVTVEESQSAFTVSPMKRQSRSMAISYARPAIELSKVAVRISKMKPNGIARADLRVEFLDESIKLILQSPGDVEMSIYASIDVMQGIAKRILSVYPALPDIKDTKAVPKGVGMAALAVEKTLTKEGD